MLSMGRVLLFNFPSVYIEALCNMRYIIVNLLLLGN